VNQNLQPGLHPDPDQLSIFVEGAATERERERMLTHLAECEECRDAVFLMRRPEETPDAQEAEPREWIWRRWLLPAGLAAAAVACGLTVMLVHVKSRSGAGGNGQIAVVQKPETPNKEKATPTIGTSAPAAQSEERKGGLRQGEPAPHTVRQAAGSNAQRTGSAAPSSSLAEKTRTGPATTPSTPPDRNSAKVTEIPLNGRNATNLQSLAPGAQSATPQDRSEAQQSLPALRVERRSGQNDTLSGVSGRVTDASGAVIPKATVALRNGSGSTRQTATGVDGSFQLTDMPAGHYELTVTAPGFKSNQQSIDLKPSELAMLQQVLDVGAASETVTVTSSAPLLQTESASVGSVTAELPSRLPVASSVSLGKRILSLDRAGSLFLSHNAGKRWKKVNPQWTGKAVTIDIETAEPKVAKRTSETSSPKNPESVFQLTTDAGAQWISKDGTHWRPQ
jgi:hypothetical protein